MWTGFKFKGKHTDDFGVITKTNTRPFMPNQKRQELDAPTIDGTYDFSSANFNDRPFYEDRIFENEISVFANDIKDLQNKISKIAIWLMGEGELIFDDMPTVVWKAKVISQVDYNPLLNGTATSVKVPFRVKPWSDSEFDTNGPRLDSNIILDSDIPLDLPSFFTYSLVGGANTITIDNIGTWYVKPTFNFSGACNSVKIEYTGKEAYALEYNDSFTKLVIDCDKQRVYDGGVINNSKATGNYLELAPGENSVKITLTTSSTVGLFVEYTPKFIYNNSWED